MQKLANQLLEINTKIDFRNSKNIEISKSDVAWHLDHILKVINGISGVLKKSKPEDYKSSFNFRRILILGIGRIPRGKARAPEKVISVGKISLEDLTSQLERAKNNIEGLELLHSKSNFQHPYFGVLNRNQAIRFLEIHNLHHLKIVNDILKK